MNPFAAADPQAQALVDLMAAASKPDLSTLSVHSVRTMFDESLKALSANSAPADIQSRDELVSIKTRNVPVRIYTPQERHASLSPGLIYFHGGAFIAGSLDTHDALCRLLSNGSGCRVISVDYCLAPEHAFPKPVYEAIAVTRWIHEHGSRIGVDSRYLAVGGDSAGGTIAAAVCHLAKAGNDPPLSQQLLIYPMTDLYAKTASRQQLSRGYFLEERMIKAFGDLYLGVRGDARHMLASPLCAQDFRGLPSTLIVTAGFDPLRDEGFMYADKLERAGVRVQRAHYERMCHGFLNATGVLDAAHSALGEIAGTLGAEMTTP